MRIIWICYVQVIWRLVIVNGPPRAEVKISPVTFWLQIIVSTLTRRWSLEIQRNCKVNWLTREIASEHLFLQLPTPRVLFTSTNQGILCKPWGQLFSLHVWVCDHIYILVIQRALTKTFKEQTHQAQVSQTHIITARTRVFTKTNRWNGRKEAHTMVQVSFQVRGPSFCSSGSVCRSHYRSINSGPMRCQYNYLLYARMG